MPFKELSFFADVKRKVVKIQRHKITTPNVIIIFTQVCDYLWCLKTFDFISFYTQKIKSSS